MLYYNLVAVQIVIFSVTILILWRILKKMKP